MGAVWGPITRRLNVDQAVQEAAPDGPHRRAGCAMLRAMLRARHRAGLHSDPTIEALTY